MADPGEVLQVTQPIQEAGPGDAGEAVVVEAGQGAEHPCLVARGALAGAVGLVDDHHLPAAGGEALGHRAAGHPRPDHQRAAFGGRLG